MKENVIFGFHAVMEAIRSDIKPDKILVKKEIPLKVTTEILPILRSANIPIQYVPYQKLDKLAKTDRHQGIVAILPVIEYADLDEILETVNSKKKRALFIMLDGVTDVRNFASICRSAESLGADGIIVPKNSSARVSAESIKISCGALNHLPVCRVDHLVDAIYSLQAYAVRILCMTEKAEDSIFSLDWGPKPVCIVMGSEDKGISRRILSLADYQVKIPLKGKVESLNVSVSAGIAMAEAVRQRS